MEVYIILTDTGTMFTKMIKVFTRYPFNHASISFTTNLETTYSFGRKRANNPFIGGFVKENLQGELFRQATCAIYKCSISHRQYDQMLQYVNRMEQQKQNYKYNFLGLFTVLLNKEWDREKAFFCSEFVATILRNGGITIKNKPTSLVSPKDFADCQEFQLLYQGSLINYIEQFAPIKNLEKEKKKEKFFPFFRSRSISAPY